MKKKNSVLIVEDDVALNDAFTTLLKKQELEVAGAFDGKEALELVKKNKYDLILLDLLMPVMDGKKFLAEYRKFDADTPVIVFTNLDSQTDIKEVQKKGATRYMLKSWASPKELINIVNDTLGAA